MQPEHPEIDSSPIPNTNDQLRLIYKLARPHSWPLIFLAIMTLAASATTLTIPWLAGNLAGNLFETQATSIYKMVGLLAIALIFSTLLTAISKFISDATVGRVLSDLRANLYNHIQSLPINWHSANQKGDILALMTSEVAHLGHFLTGTLVTTPSLIVTAAGAAIVMLRIDASLALIAPLLIPVYIIIFKLVGRRLRHWAVLEQEAEAQVFALAESNLSVISAIKSYAREDIESKKYRNKTEISRKYYVKLAQIEAIVEPISGLIASLAALALLVAAGSHLQQGRLTGPELFSFLFYAALLTRPVNELADTWSQIQVTRGTLARMTSVLSMPSEPGYAIAQKFPAIHGTIRFENVSFIYPGRAQLFDQFNLHIHASQKVAILGENGAGKSTLIALLLRLYDCQDGRITIDGNDITKFSVQDLRSQITIVPQHPQLINGTVRENIQFGRENATSAEIEEAAQKAGVCSFIATLPEGLDTQIGDLGIKLSGGQGQRIALARALLKNAPIVILDEATSMYDPSGEEQFVATCSRILHDKTVIIVTHRPASVALADRVIHITKNSIKIPEYA